MQVDERQVWSFTTLSRAHETVAMISNNCQPNEVRPAQRFTSEQTTAQAILSGQTQSVRQMGTCPLVRNQASKRSCTQTISLWARQSFSLLDFGIIPITKHLASDLEDQNYMASLE